MLVLLMIPASAYGSSGSLNDLFHPLQDLDISSFYNAYHYWVDFFIFLNLFVSVGKITLGRRFGGREGKVLSVVIGLVLALSLSLLEYRVGFSIKSFGPIAAGMLILVVGMVIFYLVKAIGAGNTGAGSFAFAITYFLIRATLPEFFQSLEANSWFAWLDLGLMVAVLISIWKIISSLWSGRNMKSLGLTLEHSRNSHDTNIQKNVSGEKREISSIKRDLKRVTKEGIKESGDIVGRLRQIIRIIDEYGSTDKGRNLIAERLNQIAPKENLILKQFAYLKDLGQKIEDFDLRSFRDLRARWDKVPEKERDIIKQEILIEKNKIISEEKLRRLESVLSRYDNDFRYSVSSAVECLKSNQPAQARDWLLKAIQCEEGAMNIFKEMNDMENRLIKLTKRELKAFKQEMKDEKG
jgi:hypothetical protein